jgi:proteasome lid subunit RPN8/RPN11
MNWFSWWDRLHERLFPRVTEYVLYPRARRAMQQMARDTHPKEAFGVLRGTHADKVLRVQAVAYQPFANTTRSAHVHIDTYTITDLIGTFHSHPTANAQPSAADLRLFARHPGVHCIVPYPYTSVAAYNQHGELLGVHRL